MSETKKCPKCGGNIVQGPGFYECLLCKYCWPFETEADGFRRQLAAKDKQIADLTRERDEMRAAYAATEVWLRTLIGSKPVDVSAMKNALAGGTCRGELMKHGQPLLDELDRLRAVNREHEKEFRAARDLCEIYYDLACIGSSENEVREKRDLIIKTRLAAAKAPCSGSCGEKRSDRQDD